MGNDQSCTKKQMETPILVYWNLHGRSDFCQAMLYAGGIEFELDQDTANAWPAPKDQSPFGQLPFFKHGDLTIAQGGSINRYCARLAGLYPSDIKEAAICDMYIEEVMDIYNGLFKPKNATDKDAKLAAWETIRNEFLPTHFALLEKNLAKSGKKFLGGNTVNAADVAFFAVYNLYDIAKIDVAGIISEYPKLSAALEGTKKFGNLPNFPRKEGIYFISDPSHDAF